MKPLPHIESIGLPPEIHADRIVGEMLRHIAATRAGTWAKVERAIRPAGSPKAQRRVVEAIKRAGGDTLINVGLQAGTRGRFKIGIFDWCAWDESRNCEIEPGAPIPARPWLACNLTHVDGREPGLIRSSMHILYVTHHALSRLAQRCGARTIKDLIDATRALGLAYVAYRVEHKEKPPNDTRIGIPGICTAIVRQHSMGGVIVATIVEPPEKRPPDESRGGPESPV